MKLLIACISAGRPGNVPAVEAMFPGCRWYVPVEQMGAYRKKSTGRVVGIPGQLPMKSRQLNWSLEHGFNREPFDVVATVDDDIIKTIAVEDRKTVEPLEVVEELAERLMESKFYLGGPYSGTNTHWAGGTVMDYGLIPGAMMLHKRGGRLSFDEDLKNLVDLDYCIQHHVKHGGVFHCREYCLANHFQTNEGGLQGYRTPAMIKECVEDLNAKWSPLCSFKEDPAKKNKVDWYVPWKKLTEGARENSTGC